mgnify:CR=1 FL=1
MKRFWLFLVLVAVLACPLSARKVGFGVAKDGEKTEDNAYGGFSAWLAYEPFEFKFGNPSLTLAMAMESDEDWDISIPGGQCRPVPDAPPSLLDHRPQPCRLGSCLEPGGAGPI